MKGTPMVAKPEFCFGQLLTTPGAIEAVARAGQSAIDFLRHHVRGDWGEVCEEDRRRNDQALIDGTRILSVYRTSLGEKLWIITEAADECGYRAATTLLLPDEY
jgi:hypothetical protein